MQLLCQHFSQSNLPFTMSSQIFNFVSMFWHISHNHNWIAQIVLEYSRISAMWALNQSMVLLLLILITVHQLIQRCTRYVTVTKTGVYLSPRHISGYICIIFMTSIIRLKPHWQIQPAIIAIYTNELIFLSS